MTYQLRLPPGPQVPNLELMEHAATRFGAPWTPLRAASVVLRARATRMGYPLNSLVPDVDSAAAAIAADVWMLALGATTLENPARYGTPAVRALAASLARAAGFPQRAPSVNFVGPTWASDELVGAIDFYIGWLDNLALPRDVVFQLASADLSNGAGDQRLLTAAQALLDA